MKGKGVAATVLKYLLLLVLAGYMVFALTKAVSHREEGVCTGVEIRLDGDTTNVLLDREGVRKLLATGGIKPEGLAFRDIDLARIDSLVASNPYVDTVAVYPLSSGKLRIWLRAAHPLLHVMGGEGVEFYIDERGHRLPAGGKGANLPIVTGKVTYASVRDRLLGLALLLRDDPYWRLETQQINIADNGDIQLIPRTGGHTIVLGDTARLADKLAKVRLFYERALPEAGWDTYKTINAEFDGQLVCTRR